VEIQCRNILSTCELDFEEKKICNTLLMHLLILYTNLCLFIIFYTLKSRTRYWKFSVYISLIFHKFKKNLSKISEIIFTESTFSWRCEPWGSWFNDNVDGTGSIAKHYTQQSDNPLLSGNVQQTQPVTVKWEVPIKRAVYKWRPTVGLQVSLNERLNSV
jgi:hypothetical protein